MKHPLRRTLVLVNGESSMVNRITGYNLFDHSSLTIHEMNVQVSDTTEA